MKPTQPTDPRLLRLTLNFRPLPRIEPVFATDFQREHCTNDFLVMNLSPQLATTMPPDLQVDRLWAHFDPDF